MVNIQALIDDAKRFETVRATRWPDVVRCPVCGCAEVTKGRDRAGKGRAGIEPATPGFSGSPWPPAGLPKSDTGPEDTRTTGSRKPVHTGAKNRMKSTL
jgi:hypothetical protein